MKRIRYRKGLGVEQFKRVKDKPLRKKLTKDCDDLFRSIIRLRDKMTCQRTGRQGDKYKFDVAHYITRGNLRVRWDEANACLMQKGLHRFWAHSRIEEFRDWWISRIGQERFDMMKLRARVRGTIYTSDLETIKFGLQLRLEELCASQPK